MPAIIITILSILFGLETPMIFTIMSIVLVASSLIAIIIYMISKEYLNNFAIEYINMFYTSEKQNIVYTEYSKNKQISILKIDTEKGNAFVGIGFRVFTTSLSTDIFMLLRNNNDIYKYIYMVYWIYSRNRYIKSFKWNEKHIKSKR